MKTKRINKVQCKQCKQKTASSNEKPREPRDAQHVAATYPRHRNIVTISNRTVLCVWSTRVHDGGSAMEFRMIACYYTWFHGLAKDNRLLSRTPWFSVVVTTLVSSTNLPVGYAGVRLALAWAEERFCSRGAKGQ